MRQDVPDSTWLCERIIDASGDAVVFADRDGVIRLWNRGAERIFGYSRTEAIGRTLDLIIPEKLRGRHWDGYRRVMETGVTRYGDEVLAVPATHKDGSRRSIEFTVALVRDDGYDLIGIAAVMRDVTARFEKERRVHERPR
jgi:PAS domain S-box-containing protein